MKTCKKTLSQLVLLFSFTLILNSSSSYAYTCELVQGFQYEREFCYRYDSLKREYSARDVNIEDISIYKSLRLLTPDAYASSGYVPWRAYAPAPLTWFNWEKGNAIIKAIHIKMNEKPDWAVTKDLLSKIHLATMRPRMLGSTVNAIYPAITYFGAIPKIGTIRNSHGHQPGFSLSELDTNMVEAIEDIRGKDGRSYVQVNLNNFYVSYLPGDRVEAELDSFLEELNEGLLGYADKTNKESPIGFAARMQRKYVAIHPFHEAQGRMSRWLQDLIFLRVGLPFVRGGLLQNDVTTRAKDYENSTVADLYDTLNQLQDCLKPLESNRTECASLYDYDTSLSKLENLDLLLMDEDPEESRKLGSLNKYESSEALLEIPVNLVKDLSSSKEWRRKAAAKAFKKIKPTDSQTLDAILKLLTQSAPDYRETAAEALINIKPTDPLLLKKLLRTFLYLESGDLWVARVLGRLEPTDPDIHQALAKALTHSQYKVRLGAAWALGHIKVSDLSIQEAIVSIINDENEKVRDAAYYAIVEIKPTRPEIHLLLVNLMSNPKEDVSTLATRALDKIKPTDLTVMRKIADLLCHSNGFVRARAARLLGELNVADVGILSDLARTLGDSAWYVISDVSGALGKLKTTDSQVLKIIVEFLNSPSEEVRYGAIETLRKMKPIDAFVHLALAKSVNDSAFHIRIAAIEALGEIKPNNPGIFQDLELLLKDSAPVIRTSATQALDKIRINGPTIQQALAIVHGGTEADEWGFLPADPRVHLALIAGLSSPDRDVRASCIEALGKAKPTDPEISRALVDLFKHPEFGIHEAAAKALAKVKPTDLQALNALVDLLSDSNSNVRSETALVLGEIKPAQPMVLKRIVDLISSSDESVRSSSLSAMGEIQTSDPEIHQLFALALDDSKEYVRYSAAMALGKVKPADLAIQKKLERRLSDSNSLVRGAAAFALGEIKTSESEIHETLALMLGDKDWNIQEKAMQALGKIKPSNPRIHQTIAKYLFDQCSLMRLEAANALKHIRPTDSSVLQALSEVAYGDKESFVRNQARAALKSFQEPETESLSSQIVAGVVKVTRPIVWASNLTERYGNFIINSIFGPNWFTQ